MPDITIIGGGIIGLLAAREFSTAGAKVTLIERQSVGREASWAGGGILLPLYPWRQVEAISVLVSFSLKLYPRLAKSLAESTGIDPEHTVSGLLVGDNPDVETAIAWCERHSIRFQRPSSADLRERMPNIRLETDNPLWLPDIAHIRNPRLLQALRADLALHGVEFFENQEVTGLALANDKVVRIETVAGPLCADYVVLATGAWSGKLWKSLIPALEIVPAKGQMLLFDAEAGLLRQMVLSGGRYLIPRRDGKILCGSTVEYVQFDKTTTAEARTLLERFALNTVPALRDYPVVGHWAGLRPATPSGIPYIDTHPRIENLALCCGHFRNGLAMGPASARLLADLVLGRAPSLAPEPYAIDARH